MFQFTAKKRAPSAPKPKKTPSRKVVEEEEEEVEEYKSEPVINETPTRNETPKKKKGSKKETLGSFQSPDGRRQSSRNVARAE